MSERPLIACLDVHYVGDQACAAAIVVRGWTEHEWVGEHTVLCEVFAPYRPGQLYRRELPPVLEVLERLPDAPDVFIVDGYVWLDDQGGQGLGAHLHAVKAGRIPVIGIAKNPLPDTSHAREVLRGDSQQPLYVTAAGVELDEAAARVQALDGDFRLPDVARRADAVCRGGFGP